jgi:hypothetical protein
MPKIEVDVPQEVIDALPNGHEIALDRAQKGGFYLTPSQSWAPWTGPAKSADIGIVARPIRPWYPASWLDEAGNPLPDVHEVTPGEWPPCKPGDVVEVLTENSREVHRDLERHAVRADERRWSAIVAIRIIRRAGE